jgi:hypothetical protein
VTTVAVGLALHTGVLTTRELNDSQLIQAQAQTFVDRIVRQNFGMNVDPDPTVDQIDAIFDLDMIPGNVTINQLTRWPAGDGGWRFTMAGFPVQGEWLVTVDQDIDGDHVIAGALETSQEIFAIRILFNNELVLRTCRAKEPTL